MNIQALKFSKFDSGVTQSKPPVSIAANNFGLRMAQPLTKDTVSFRASRNSIAGFVQQKFSKDSERLNRLATIYLDVLESVANKLKGVGVSFDRAYCEISPVKSPESYVSKIKRSGKFQVPDQIRATMYLDNPYDLSVLNDALLPELEKRGYVIAKNEMRVEDAMRRGYIPTPEELKKGEVLLPDLDIRLSDVASQVTKLKPELRYSISQPQKSGYEDIQMRLVRDFETRKNPMQFELLILFGPNYKEAKSIEAKKIYEYVRLFDELNVKTKGNDEQPHAKIIYRYIDLIRQMMTGKFSQKLYENAKNKDLYKITDEIPLKFTKEDLYMYDNYFDELLIKISAYYKEARAKLKEGSEARRILDAEARKDRLLVKQIRENLKKSIEFLTSKKHHSK